MFRVVRRSYSEKLKDPRWQKLRLEILARDGWKCTSCESTNVTLHVHHWWYDKGKEPWEADPDSLSTLCESCHQSETEERPEAERELLLHLKKSKIDWFDLSMIASYIQKHSEDIVRSEMMK